MPELKIKCSKLSLIPVIPAKHKTTFNYRLLFTMKKILPYIKNKYTLTLLGFIVWVSFFDKNDMISQMELRKEVKKLEEEKKYFVTEIGKNKSDMKELMTNPKNLEKFAREKYLMKKDNEDVFVLVEEKGK